MMHISSSKKKPKKISILTKSTDTISSSSFSNHSKLKTKKVNISNQTEILQKTNQDFINNSHNISKKPKIKPKNKEINISQNIEAFNILNLNNIIKNTEITINLIEEGTKPTYLNIQNLENKWVTARNIQNFLNIKNVGDKTKLSFNLTSKCGEGGISIICKDNPHVSELTTLYKKGEKGVKQVLVTNRNATEENQVVTLELI